MICPNCRQAGRQLAGGYPDTAAFMHALCPARTRGATHCDCQHDTTQSYINRGRTDDGSTGGRSGGA